MEALCTYSSREYVGGWLSVVEEGVWGRGGKGSVSECSIVWGVPVLPERIFSPVESTAVLIDESWTTLDETAGDCGGCWEVDWLKRAANVSNEVIPKRRKSRRGIPVLFRARTRE